MRRLAIAACMMTGSACMPYVAAFQIPFYGGGYGYDVRCAGKIEACQVKASELCARGHDVVKTEQQGRLIIRCRSGYQQPIAPTYTAAPLPSTPAHVPPVEKSPEEIVSAAQRSVYLITTPTGQGTGFGIAGGRIVTNLHVVAGQSQIFATDSSDQKHQVVGVHAFDSQRDLAVLDLGHPLSSTLALAALQLPAAGAPVTVVGNPRGLQGSVSTGVVSATRILSKDFTVLQIDAAVSPGSSGGPVLDRNGRVVAVVVASLTSGQNLNFAIPVRYLYDALDRSQGTVALSTFAATTAHPEPPTTPPPAKASSKRPSFPRSVAGFTFGMSIPDAQQACNGQLAGDPSFASCPFEPVDVPFADSIVSMRFEAGQITMISLLGENWDGVGRAVVAKYGDPDLVQMKRGQDWIRVETWKNKTVGRATWWLDGGMLTVISTDGRHVGVVYMPAGANAVREQNY